MGIKTLIIYFFMILMISHVPSFASPSEGQKQAYFSVLPDIPLMPRMQEIEGQSFIFDKSEGRVVESVGFLSASSPEKVLDFYREALKTLGWKPLNTNGFSRNDEQITLKIEEVPKGIVVRFRLSPQPLPLSR